MSRLAFQAYLTSCKSFEKLKISFGRDTKQKFAWRENTSENEAYEKGPAQCQKVKLIRRHRKGNVLTICGGMWHLQHREGRGRKRKGKKSKDPQKRVRKYWLRGTVSAWVGIRVLKHSRVVCQGHCIETLWHQNSGCSLSCLYQVKSTEGDTSISCMYLVKAFPLGRWGIQMSSKKNRLAWSWSTQLSSAQEVK